MKKSKSKPVTSETRALAGLGEQLTSTTSLALQRDRIVRMTQRLVAGQVDLWIAPNLFRLPGRSEDEAVFPEEPELKEMRKAYKSGKPVLRAKAARSQKAETLAAYPLVDQGMHLGVLQVRREDGSEFQPDETELLEGLSNIVSVGLFAAHRVAVESFRQNQLHLVREVSAQVANVMDIDLLSERVTELILETFDYYYVGIFTLEGNSQKLRFRACASTRKKGRQRVGELAEVEIGQGLIGKAAQTGERILVDNVQEDQRYRFIPGLPETRSEVVLPLKIEDRVLGILDVQSDQVQAFHPNDLLILDTLAVNVARAVEGANLYGDLRRRADQLELIAEVSDTVTSSLELGEVLQKAAELIHKRFGRPLVNLFSVHPNRRQVIHEAGSGEPDQGLEGFVISLDEPGGFIPQVARTGSTIISTDVSQEPAYAPLPVADFTACSELCVPLVFDQQVVGVMDLQSDQPGAFTEDDRLLFEAVADNIASAIHNADLYQSEQWRRQAADSLREVAVLLSANVGVEQVLDAILTELNRTLPVDISAIWLLEEGDLYLAAVRGCEAAVLEEARNSSLDAAVAITSVLVSDGPVIRTPQNPKWPCGLAAGFETDYSSIAAPLQVGGQPVGVLTLAHSTPGRYGHEAQAMTTTFASYAAVAIENARLYDSAQEQAYASAALLQVAQAVVSLNDLDEILGTIVRIMPILVGVDRTLLYLWDAESEAFTPYEEYGLSESEEEAFWQSDYVSGASMLLDAVREKMSLIAVPVDPETSFQKWMQLEPLEKDKEEEALSGTRPLLLAVPLLIKNGLFGILLVQEVLGGLRFRNRRLEIINGIAQQAALAIQNDRLQEEMVIRERLETEVQLARQIQQTFIPETLPSYPGWDLAARWRTARQMGGDFYDVMELPGNRLGLLIADVADKGIPAALFMALTRTLVRAAVKETASPAAALRQVNDLLIPDTKQGMFVTGVYAVLDRETGTLVYANAGHNPPLWVRHDGAVQKLTRTGMALGVLEGEQMEEGEIQLGSGDRLLLYTDGLSESFSADGEMFGESRVIAILNSDLSLSAEGTLQAIEEELLAFVGEEAQSDDLTMLLVRREP